ncbi:MAG: DUF4147 domain-containing protein [Candidatus Andersenbacteria bacterium]|nr:DUF4147 domain-containing protein [bacterium]MDZ4225429.1 DUF4147 domain-containing protein [Candidatus Andersenbacteria bacterium]
MADHLIKNFDALAQTQLRRDALTILEAGLNSADTTAVTKNKVRLSNNVLSVGNNQYQLTDYKRIFVVAIGKVANAASSVLENILGNRLAGGISLSTTPGNFKVVTSLTGTHPMPSEQNIAATSEIINLVKQLNSDDLLIVVVSGGGSALLCQPLGVTVQELVSITKHLFRSGADIHEINTIRKHLSAVKGGRLVALANGAAIAGLIYSDIADNDISLVASGPTFPDSSTIADADAVIEKYDIRNTCHLPDLSVQETPKEPNIFSRVRNELIVSNKTAISDMKKTAADLGYQAKIFNDHLTGEARLVGVDLARAVAAGQALIAAGETTVTVTGQGTGGRNQELTLGALATLPDNTLVLSCASDGVDNSPPAGAIADDLVKQKAANLKLDPSTYLQNNDSLNFFQAVEAAIITGPTGINIADLMLAIRK